MNDREFKIWDVRKMEKFMDKGDFPNGIGPSHIHIDREHKLVFVDFRGDPFIGLYGYDPAEPGHLAKLQTLKLILYA